MAASPKRATLSASCIIYGVSSLTLPSMKLLVVNTKKNYYSTHEEKLFSDQKQKITYTFNDKEQTIIGIIEEKGDFIYLYEYRGKYVGVEFFISFSKQSLTYKLIKVNEVKM